MSSELRVDKIIPTAGVPTGGGGGIIQVVQSTRTDTDSTSSSTFADILTVSITPKSNTSKFLLFGDLKIGYSNYTASVFWKFVRDSTDIFVGFHSTHGWEVVLENGLRHFGLPENHDLIFLFIATFPVVLDTVFKYWIFRYLNQVSPSAVATYHEMND